MAEAQNFWVDGEKIPDSRLNEVFKTPPDARFPILRNALVIGARGAGKTTLFRHLKESYRGVAIHLSLAAELGCIQKETGLGSLAKESTMHFQSLLPGKAIALLCAAIAERVARKRVTVPGDALRECLPADLRTAKRGDADDYSGLKANIVETRVQGFGGLSTGRPLLEFVSALGKASEAAHGPLLLLLDRADMVNAQCLLPVFELLDQVGDYTALIAMRPGHTNDALEEIATHVIPGDHYDVIHLGLQPRLLAWHKFVEESVRAQAEIHGFRGQFDRIPDEVRSWITFVARDSVRTALELYARYLNADELVARTELVEAVEDARDSLLIASQPSLQKFSSDFRGFSNDIRSEARRTAGEESRPIYLSIKQKPKEDLFSDTPAWIGRFVEEGLRCGAFCMPAGQRWVPGLHPAEIEIAPLLMYDTKSHSWRTNDEPIQLGRDEAEIRRSYGRSRTRATIFVAYRMRATESKQFRTDIEDEIRFRGDLHGLVVIDGTVPAGTAWASEIRSRISDARAVLGDVTRISSEVLFEMGFAYGLKKITIGAINDLDDRNALPKWLSITQLGSYATRGELSALVSSIAAHLRDPDLAKLPEPKQPVPELVVLLRRFAWNIHGYDQVAYLAQRVGLTLAEFNESEHVV